MELIETYCKGDYARARAKEVQHLLAVNPSMYALNIGKCHLKRSCEEKDILIVLFFGKLNSVKSCQNSCDLGKRFIN